MLARQQVLSKPIKIEFTPGRRTLLEVDHDSDQIHQVLLNLVAEFGAGDRGAGVVRVAVFTKDDGDDAVDHRVRHGPRNSSPSICRIFFGRFIRPRETEPDLGLSLARRIVEEHHGRIDVESSSGKGTTFSVTLPMRQPAAVSVA